VIIMDNKIPNNYLPEIRPIVQPKGIPAGKNSIRSPGTSFEDIYQKEVDKHNLLKFSAHAKKRLDERKVNLDVQALQEINKAVQKAEAKGARDSLLLLGDLALIASIKNRTIVTAVDKENMREHVFTNIDSAVIIR
jgi:flagellar operon protein